jgi:hypothetical protein
LVKSRRPTVRPGLNRHQNDAGFRAVAHAGHQDIADAVDDPELLLKRTRRDLDAANIQNVVVAAQYDQLPLGGLETDIVRVIPTIDECARVSSGAPKYPSVIASDLTRIRPG